MSNLRLAAVGDIQLGDQTLCFGFGIRSRFDNKYNALIKDQRIIDFLKNADLVSGNLECSYDNINELKFNENSLCANGAALRFLKSLGLNILNLANNHTLERGEQGLFELSDSLQTLDIKYTGLNSTYRTVKHSGNTIAFFGYSDIADYKNISSINIWNESELETIRKISKYVDLIVVNIHWGFEFITHPSERQIELGRKLIESGAHIVLGHHPHVLQPVEKYKNGVIAYSLGNFIFDGIYSKRANSSMILVFDINLKNKNIIFKIVPLTINNDYTVEINDNRESVDAIVSQPITIISPAIYNHEVLRLRKNYRYSVLWHAIANFNRYKNKLMILGWIIRRIILILKNRKNELINPSDIYLWRKES